MRGGGDPSKNQGDPERGHETPRDHVSEFLRKDTVKDYVLREGGGVKGPKRDAELPERRSPAPSGMKRSIATMHNLLCCAQSMQASRLRTTVINSALCDSG